MSEFNIKPLFKRHKYNVNSDSSKGINGSIVQCVRCGAIREYVKGKPTYFIGDSVYVKSPGCSIERIVDYSKKVVNEKI